MKYDILIQNNGSKEIFIISGQTNTSDNHLYFKFEDLILPERAQDGEYTYAIINNDLPDVEYELKSVLLDSKVSVSGQTYTLRDLKPVVGLMRVGEVEDKNTYRETDNKTYYYKK